MEYALILGVVVVAIIGAVQYVTDEGSSELSDRTNRVGAPDVDDVGLTPGTSTPPPPSSVTTTPTPAQTVTLAGVVGCWSPGNGASQWNARFTFTLENASGDPVTAATVTGELRTYKSSGAPAVEPVEVASTVDGQVVVTLQKLKFGNGPQESWERRVELDVVDVTGDGLSYTPGAFPTAVANREGASC